MNQEGGIIPLTWEQQEAVHLRQGERLVSAKESLSRILEALIEQYGLEPIKLELAEMERKIELVETELSTNLTIGGIHPIFDTLERWVEKLRNG